MNKFGKDSVVCFLGDSIAQDGRWIRRVFDYYRLEQKIPCRMFNCGVSGDIAMKGRFRLEDTVFPYHPTDVVIALGLNDCGCSLYRSEPLTDRQILERRRRLDTSVAFLRIIADECIKRSIRVTFCTPTLPDELTSFPTPNFYGAAGALLELSLRIQALAQELRAHVIDFSFPFRDILLKLYKNGQTLIREDRVHPLTEGHELMARLFLRGQGFEVSIPETWEELHALAQIPHDDWETRRFRLEKEANCNIFVEWSLGFGAKTQEAMAAVIQTLLATEEREEVRQMLESYMSNRDQIPSRRQALIDHTNTVCREEQS